MTTMIMNTHFLHNNGGTNRRPYHHSTITTSSSSPLLNKTKEQRSPYVVLELLKPSSNSDMHFEITKQDIQTAFRSKAKIYHPDLNPLELPIKECEYLMTELVTAYETLMIGGDNDDNDNDFISKYQIGHSNKVALACELYTIQELQIDRFHNVYPIRIEYENDDNSDEGEQKNNNSEDSNPFTSSNVVNSDSSNISATSFISTYNIYPIHTHPDDSVLDLKRIIQNSQYGIEWNLISSTTTDNDHDHDHDDGIKSSSSNIRKRKKDRDGITIGWELIVVKNHSIQNNNSHKRKGNINDEYDDYVQSNTKISIDDEIEKVQEEEEEKVVINEVLSYHLFLGDDYQIQNGDTIYAVIRK